MTWEAAAKEWSLFLEAVNDTRRTLRCSWTSPWFRGHTDSSGYKLLPGILRKQAPRDVARIRKLNGEIDALRPQIAKAKTDVKTARTPLTREYRAGNIGLAKTAEGALRVRIAQRNRLMQAVRSAQSQIDKINLVPNGEREAFIEFSARSGQQFANSWEVLAAMQHCGVPTRLLDWSETLSAALFFALKRYSQAIDKVWANDKRSGQEGPFTRSPSNILSMIGALRIPSIWVLNPFRASMKATDRNRIWDISRQPEYDYFQQFVVSKEWPFEDPIPAFSPWRSPRMAAQQGTFVVWGRDRRSLDQILGPSHVSEIAIKPLAAVYGVHILKHMLAIDHFTLFRDLDSLSAAITERYIK